MIAGLIAGAGVALVSYVSNVTEATKAENENAVATEELVEKYQELHDQIEQNQEARQANIEGVENEAAVADVLIGKIEELAGKENKSNAEKELMAGYVDKLNQIYPGLNAQYDKEKDALSLSVQEMRNYVTASKEMILAKAEQQN